jgi:hypothetical protein
VTTRIQSYATVIIPVPAAVVLGSFRIPPTTKRRGTMIHPPHTRRGRRPTFSVVKNEIATKDVWTALMSAMTRSPDLLDRDCGDEWFRLSGLLEEIGCVTEHNWGPYPKLIVEREE